MHWSNENCLVATKLKTTRKVIKKFISDSAAYVGYEGNIYFQLDKPVDSDDFPNGGFYPAFFSSGVVCPKDLAGKDVVYKGRLYTFVPEPEINF